MIRQGKNIRMDQPHAFQCGCDFCQIGSLPVLVEATSREPNENKTSTSFVLIYTVNMFQTWLQKKALKKIQAEFYTCCHTATMLM